MNNTPFLGPRLVDSLLREVDRMGLTGHDLHVRYGVGVTWLADVRAGRTNSPSADTVQRLYEALTGEPLLAVSPDGAGVTFAGAGETAGGPGKHTSK